MEVPGVPLPSDTVSAGMLGLQDSIAAAVGVMSSGHESDLQRQEASGQTGQGCPVRKVIR